MSNFKKFFIVFLSALVAVSLFVVPFSAFATNYYCHLDEQGFAVHDYNSSTSYFYFGISDPSVEGTVSYNYWNSHGADNIDVNAEGNILSITGIDSTHLVSGSYFVYTSSSGLYLEAHKFSAHTLRFDMSAHTVDFIDYMGNVTETHEVLAFDSNFIEQRLSEGSLDVEFLPIDFTGTVNESYTYQGATGQLFQIDCTITNTTAKNYQVCWAILPKDESLDFNFHHGSNYYGLSGANGQGYSEGKGCSKPIWVHMQNQWYYGFDPVNFSSFDNSGIDSLVADLHSHYVYPDADIFDIVGQKCYAPCSWSFVQAGSSVNLRSCTKNMKLLKGKEYTCKVYAIETELDGITCIDRNAGKGEDSQGQSYDVFQSFPCLDFTHVEEIYSSNFKMGFNTDFYEQWDGAGIISFDPDVPSQQYWNATIARETAEGCEVAYNNGYTGKVYNPYSGLNPFIGMKGYDDFGSSSDNSTISNSFLNIFSAIKLFFKYFPEQVVSLSYFSLTCKIVLSIIKKVL